MAIEYMEVTDLSIPDLQIYTDSSEVALLRYFEPEPGIFIAESPNVIMRALNAGYEPISFLMEERYRDSDVIEFVRRMDNIRTGACVCDSSGTDSCAGNTSGTGNVRIYLAPQDVISRITGYPMTRGMLCAMRRKPLPATKDILGRRIVILEDVMNPTNLGAIVRSAAALGMDGIILSKGCTDPLYRRADRVSMGTVFQIPWTYAECDSLKGLLEKLRSEGFVSLAMALKDDSLNLDDEVISKIKKNEKLAIVLGSEGPGLRDDTIEACDHTIKIPMAGGVDSLNVAAASAVMFWALK